MSSAELKTYIAMVLIEEQTDDLHEMANLGPQNHGIDNIVIWVGRANKQHGLLIKVSNLKNRWCSDDNFVIQMPSLDYDPTQVAKWISPSVMQQIISWITLNYKVLHDYELDIIMYTDDFLRQLSKI